MSPSTCNGILVILTSVVSLYLALLIAEDIFCIVASMIERLRKRRKEKEDVFRPIIFNKHYAKHKGRF